MKARMPSSPCLANPAWNRRKRIALHRELMIDARFIEGGTNIHYLEQKLADMPDLGKNLNGGSPSIAKKSEIKADA